MFLCSCNPAAGRPVSVYIHHRGSTVAAAAMTFTSCRELLGNTNDLIFCFAVYRFQQVSDIVHRRNKQLQQQSEEDPEGDEEQSMDMWLLTDSTLAQLMDPQLAAPAVQFLVLEVTLCPAWFPWSFAYFACTYTLYRVR